MIFKKKVVKITTWLTEKEEQQNQKKLCDNLARNLEAFIEEAGFYVSTPILESAERALYRWKHQ